MVDMTPSSDRPAPEAAGPAPVPPPRAADFLEAVREISARFAAESSVADPATTIRSEAWPTVGDMVDHLGQIQRWAAAVVESGESTPREPLARPADRDRSEWMTESSALLINALSDADVPCWTFVGPGTAAFWFRRQAHEARKHLWDIRTGSEPAPLLPDAGGAAVAADVLDELFGVFLARSRRKGLLEPLPSTLRLEATDAAVSWTIGSDWQTSRSDGASSRSDGVPAPDPRSDATASPVTLRARLGDLVLFGWDRAIPVDLPDRFEIDGDATTLAAYRSAPVHP